MRFETLGPYLAAPVIGVVGIVVGKLMGHSSERSNIQDQASAGIKALADTRLDELGRQALELNAVKARMDELEKAHALSEAQCQARLLAVEARREEQIDALRREHHEERRYLENRVDELNRLVLAQNSTHEGAS